MATKREVDDTESAAVNPKCEKKPRISRMDFKEMVTVLVGKEREAYPVPRNILTKRSPFFKAACKDEWQRDGVLAKKTIELTDHEPTTFDIYLQLLYTGELFLFPDGEPNNDQAGGEGDRRFGDTHYPPLLELYHLAHYVGDLATCHTVIDAWIEVDDVSSHLPSETLVSAVYEYLPTTCGLMRLLKDQYLYLTKEGLAEMLECSSSLWPKEFINDLFKHCFQLLDDHQARVTVSQKPRCRYHFHNQDVPKCIGKRTKLLKFEEKGCAVGST